MILKQVIHYPDTNSVEATWVERITLPQQEISEGIADLVMRTQEVTVKCHSYSDRQMDMLRADLGADASAHADLIAKVEANMIPAPVPTEQELQAVVNATALAYLASTDWMAIRFSETGTPIPPDVLEARRAARDKVVRI